ncbi:hypothetical protein EDB82DRAFT_232664 [Fusarium venenatum]|uniref:uncharacterized protein n=1 Tax=Fusarium venenatum TaxID=56646 RepID=UPI001DCE95BA|nr:hypothetical protein EDB82DRAFT_232664 [Fusarium venenatum]
MERRKPAQTPHFQDCSCSNLLSVWSYLQLLLLAPSPSTLKLDLNLFGLHRRHHIWPQIEPTRTLVCVRITASDLHCWQSVSRTRCYLYTTPSFTHPSPLSKPVPHAINRHHPYYHSILSVPCLALDTLPYKGIGSSSFVRLLHTDRLQLQLQPILYLHRA